jgi:hypothetical protein
MSRKNGSICRIQDGAIRQMAAMGRISRRAMRFVGRI